MPNALRIAEVQEVPRLLALQRQTFISLLVALGWGLSGAIAEAQQLASKPSAVPTPIPLSEIASQAESTVRSAQSIGTSLSTDQITATVENRLLPLACEIELRAGEMAKFLTGTVPLELLHSMEVGLQRYAINFRAGIMI